MTLAVHVPSQNHTKAELLKKVDHAIDLCLAHAEDPAISYELDQLRKVRADLRQNQSVSQLSKGENIVIGAFAAKNIEDWNPALADVLMEVDYSLRHPAAELTNISTAPNARVSLGRVRSSHHLGTFTELPKLELHISSRHIYTRVVDTTGATLISASTYSIEGSNARGVNRSSLGAVVAAKNIGKLIAEEAQAQGIKHVVFKRGSYLPRRGKKAFEETLRSAGLELQGQM